MTPPNLQPLSPMEGALLKSLIESSDAQAKQLAELQSLLAPLETQLQEARNSLVQTSKERDELQRALAECQQSLAGDALVQIPTAEEEEMFWIRPSAFKRFRITAPVSELKYKTQQSGDTEVVIPRIDPKTGTPLMGKNPDTGQLEPLYEMIPTGSGMVRTLFLDGDLICTLPIAAMAKVEAAIHRALNPHPKKEPSQS